jgi:hypothetical protein
VQTVSDYADDGDKSYSVTTEFEKDGTTPHEKVETWYTQDGIPAKETTTEYDGKGVVTLKVTDEFKADGSTIDRHTVAEYEDGLIMESVTDDGHDNLIEKTVYEYNMQPHRSFTYDGDGNLTNVANLDAEGRVEATFKFDAEGGLREAHKYDPATGAEIGDLTGEELARAYLDVVVDTVDKILGEPDGHDEHGRPYWNAQYPDGSPIKIMETGESDYTIHRAQGDHWLVYNVNQNGDIETRECPRAEGGGPDVEHYTRIERWPANGEPTGENVRRDGDGHIIESTEINLTGRTPDLPPPNIEPPPPPPPPDFVPSTGGVDLQGPDQGSTRIIDRGPTTGGPKLGLTSDDADASRVWGRDSDSLTDDYSGRRSDSAGGADFLSPGAAGSDGVAGGGDASGADGSPEADQLGDALDLPVEFAMLGDGLDDAELAQSAPEIFGDVSLADAADHSIEQAGAFTDAEIAGTAVAQGEVSESEDQQVAMSTGGDVTGAAGEEAAGEEGDETGLTISRVGTALGAVAAVAAIEITQRAGRTPAPSTDAAKREPKKPEDEKE